MRMKPRSLGGLVGVVAALAGGIGAAAGFYSLPDPLAANVTQDAYVRADERAMAVMIRDNGDGTYMEMRIEASRGGSSGTDAGAYAQGFPQAHGGQTVDAFFFATIQTCNQDGECYDRLELDADDRNGLDFPAFDPLLRSASFSGNVRGCQFDITWTGEGELAPFAGLPFTSSHVVPWNAGVDSNNGYAETSRVALADIDMCFGTFEDVNGYLSRGARRVNAGAGGGFE
ncbi:MAG: hypothetical protein ACRDJM_04765 [Actinomycetota bacterium]